LSRCSPQAFVAIQRLALFPSPHLSPRYPYLWVPHLPATSHPPPTRPQLELNRKTIPRFPSSPNVHFSFSPVSLSSPMILHLSPVLRVISLIAILPFSVCSLDRVAGQKSINVGRSVRPTFSGPLLTGFKRCGPGRTIPQEFYSLRFRGAPMIVLDPFSLLIHVSLFSSFPPPLVPVFPHV